MSPRGNPKLLLIKKQKKLITSRLMQISLEVDDYIYKNKPISAKDAAKFINEVSGYQDKCFEDIRSLQVIEKLIRCMKRIIEEHNELQEITETDDVTLVDVETILASPVDDDITQFTHKEIDVLESPKNHIEADFEDNDTNTNDYLNRNEIIDLYGDNYKNTKDEVKSHNKRDITSNEQLQRAISNLTIGDKDDPLSLEPFNSDHCSQSILNDVAFFNEINEKHDTNKVVYSQDFEAVIQPATINKECVDARVVKSVSSIRVTRNISKNYLNLSKSPINTNPLGAVATTDVNSYKTNNNITKEKGQRKRRQKTDQKRNENYDQEMKLIPVKKNKQKKKAVKQNVLVNRGPEHTYKTNENSYKSDGVKSLDGTVQNKRKNDNLHQRASTEVTPNPQNNFIEKTTTNAVYNKDVENDLSWIENIRFVREVTLEENIPAYFEDCFWENYMLPNDLNNDDFLYLG